jgi:hypothetical protein
MTGKYSNSDTDVVSYRNRSKESVYSDGQELKFHQYTYTLTNLTLPHLCVCPKQRPEFPTSYVVVAYMCI